MQTDFIGNHGRPGRRLINATVRRDYGRGTLWTDADRLTYAYLCLEMARSVVRDYEATLAAELQPFSAQLMALARAKGEPA